MWASSSAASPARSLTRPCRTSWRGPRATRSTPRNCSLPAPRARRCRWPSPTCCWPGWSSARRRHSRCCASRPWPVAGCGTSWWPPSAPRRRRNSTRPWPRRCTTTCSSCPTTGDTGSGTRCCVRRCWPTCCPVSGSGCTRPSPRTWQPRPGRAPRQSGRTTRGRATTCRARSPPRWKAAVDACRVGAPAEQLQYLESALALWSAVPDAAERAGRDQAALLFETAAVARTVGEPHRAVALLRAALQALGDDADPAVRARVHYTLAQTMTRVEDVRGAHRESAAALALVPADPPSEVRTWAAATHARMSYALGLTAEADAAAEEALAAADALGLDSAWSDTAVSQVRSRGDADPVLVRRRLDEALQRARRSGDVDVEMRVLFNRATVAFEAGRIAEALDDVRHATTRARHLGMEWAFYPAELRHLQVTALFMAGEWDASLAEADLLARVPEMAAHVRAAGLLVLVGRGDPSARERLDWARALIPRLKEHVLLGLVTAAAEIDLHGWSGDAQAAADVATTASHRLQVQWADDHLGVIRLVGTALSPVGDAAAAARLVGDDSAADRWVAVGEALVGLARSAVDVFAREVGEMGVEGKAWLARLEAEAARLRGKVEPELWRTSVEAFGFGHVYEVARSRRRLAEALLAADDRAGAAAEARAAHEVAVRLGARPLREAVEALARRGGLGAGPPGGGRAAGPGGGVTPPGGGGRGRLGEGRPNPPDGARA